MKWLRKVFHWIQRVWGRFREWRAVLRPAWLAALLAAVTAGALHVDQALDALRKLTEPDAEARTRWFLALAAAGLTLVAWYFPRAMLYVRYRFTPPGAGSRYRGWRTWVPRLIGLLPLLSLTAAFLRLEAYGFALACAGLAALFLGFWIWRRRSLERRADRSMSTLHDGFSQVGRWTFRLPLILLAVSLLLLILFLNSKVLVPQSFGPIGILLAAIAIWTAAGSAAVYLSSRFTIPSILGTLLVFAVVFSVWNDNHQVRTLDGSGWPVSGRQVSEHFRQWVRERSDGWRAQGGAGPYPVYVVAAEGGGIRAAYWTASVLARMEDEVPGFACHLYAVSGVSGGSVGAAVFAALMEARLRADPEYACDGRRLEAHPRPLLPDARAVLGRDFLAPALAGWLFPDLMQRFWPIPGPADFPRRWAFPDRARYLEASWEESWESRMGNERFAESFRGLWSGRSKTDLEMRYQVPSLLLNGTWVETGGRNVTSNLVVEGEPRFVDVEDLLQDLGRPVPLSTAAHMGARFTYISPAGTLEVDGGARRVVDGGYFENSGALTASEVVATIRDCGDCAMAVRPIAVYLKNGGPPPPESSDSPVPLVETLSPARALLQTRGARGRHSEELLRRTAGPDAYEKIALQRMKGDPTIPLGWVLSAEVRREIDEQVDALPGGLAVARQIAAPPAAATAEAATPGAAEP